MDQVPGGQRRVVWWAAVLLLPSVVGVTEFSVADGIPPSTTAVELKAGPLSTCGVGADGSGRCWGNNEYGQLGDGSTTSRDAPVAVTGLSGVASISIGYSHACAATTTGAAYCWGANSLGQLGDGTTSQSLSPRPVSGLSAVTAIGAGLGGGFTCALRSTGQVFCWGVNWQGQLGDGTNTNRLYPTLVSGVSGATQIAVGNQFACALLSSGGIRCWGANYYGALGDSTTTTRNYAAPVNGITSAVRLSAGDYHVCAALSDRTARCWGWNYYGMLGDGTSTTRPTPVPVTGLSDATAVAAGQFHSCALTTSGTARCWGYNAQGQLGDGTSTQRTTPVQVSGLAAAGTISAGGAHSCSALLDGSARCWGSDGYGALGDGATTGPQPRPVRGYDAASAAAPATPTNPSPGAPTQSAATPVAILTPTLTWDPSAGTTKYFVNLRRMSDGALLLSGHDVGNRQSWPVTSGLLTQGETYRWGVQAGNDAGTSTQTAAIYFRVVAPTVVAFGDSVAAGYGLGQAFGYPNNPSAYPALVATSIGGVSRNYAITGACAGPLEPPATCANTILEDELPVFNTHAAMEQISPTLITITVGANDIRFSGCLEALVDQVHRDPAKDPCATSNLQASLGTLAANLDAVFASLQSRYPSAQIAVTEYYNPLPKPVTAPENACEFWYLVAARKHGGAFIAAGDGAHELARTFQRDGYDYAADVIRELNAVIRAAAAKANVVSVPLFEFQQGGGHDFCRADRGGSLSDVWVYGPEYYISIEWLGFGTQLHWVAPETCSYSHPDVDRPRQGTDTFPGGRTDYVFFVNCMPHPTVAGQRGIADSVRLFISVECFLSEPGGELEICGAL